jgi:hypothetical protein
MLLLSTEVSFVFLFIFGCFYKKIVDIIYQSTAYDTAHFLQWAKEKFREELTGRLTAQV